MDLDEPILVTSRASESDQASNNASAKSSGHVKSKFNDSGKSERSKNSSAASPA